MRLVSVNVGIPREVSYGRRIVKTGIFKKPVPEKIHLGKKHCRKDGAIISRKSTRGLPLETIQVDEHVK
jgi:MOSC domain-containing protein YiiM